MFRILSQCFIYIYIYIYVCIYKYNNSVVEEISVTSQFRCCAHIRVRGIPQGGSNVGSHSVNHRVEQLLLAMNLQHYLFFGLNHNGL